MGKRPEFIAGEKIGEAREPVIHAGRLRGQLSLRSMGTGNGVRDKRKVINQRRTVDLRASPSSA